MQTAVNAHMIKSYAIILHPNSDSGIMNVSSVIVIRIQMPESLHELYLSHNNMEYHINLFISH